MKVIIDKRELEAFDGETILACALRNCINIPHLCYHPQLEPFGACRMCVVKVKGMKGFTTSCTTPVFAGMEVVTSDEEIINLRKRIMELILLEHPSACILCDRKKECEQFKLTVDKAGHSTGCHTCSNKDICQIREYADEFGIEQLPSKPFYRNLPIDRRDPFIDKDLNLCVLCGKCVRICKQHQNWAVIDFIGRGSDTIIGGAFGRSFMQSGCRFCGSCVDICPTGALTDRYARWYGQPERFVETTCPFCPEACAICLGVKNGKVITAKANDFRFPICILGRFAIPEFVNHPDRLTVPYARIGKLLTEASWEGVILKVSRRLADYYGNLFAFICDTTSSVEDRQIFREFTEKVMKSPHFIEIKPKKRGISYAILPDEVKAAITTGNFVHSSRLDKLELLIVMDCFPTEASERADFILPVAMFAECTGSLMDGNGKIKPFTKAVEPPGLAKPEGEIISKIAEAMHFKMLEFKVQNARNSNEKELCKDRNSAPLPAISPFERWTHYRGHHIDEKVKGLREFPWGSAYEFFGVEWGKGKYELVKNVQIAPNIFEIIIKAPHIAKKAQPGQFVILMVDQKSERIPFTLCDWDADNGTITLIVLEVGWSTRKLTMLKAGDRIEHIAGPLGKPIEIRNFGTVALAGGCYGAGAILKVAQGLRSAGNKVISITEARSHYLHYYNEKLSKYSNELLMATMDGSLGVKGHTVDIIEDLIKKGEKIDLVYAVGCLFMMKIITDITRQYGIKTLVALNPIMVDGTGMCGACRVMVGKEMKFACVDGPFFDGHLVDWDELKDRKTAYSEEETRSLGRTEPIFIHNGICDR